MEKPSPLDEAIALVGSQQALAEKLGVKPPSVSEWRKRGKAPADRCRAIEAATGGVVTRYRLRPDVFGKAPVGLTEPDPDPDVERIVPVESA